MKASALIVTIAVAAISCRTATDRPHAALGDSVSALGGRAPIGREWVTENALKQCARRPVAAGLQLVDAVLPDSAETIALARAFLGARLDSARVVMTSLAHTSDGVLVQLRDTSADRLDGSNTVYIDRSRCVTYLGW